METEILEESAGFFTHLLDLLAANNSDHGWTQGSLRDGGRIPLNRLGDGVWLEQFR
jgi:hypothetical protein